MNKVILMGRLATDPTFKTLPTDKCVSTFTIAVPRRFAKEGQQQADFLNCVAWGNTAKFISSYFSKGSMIAIDGRMQSRTYEDGNNKKHYVTEVIIDEAYFTGEKKESTPTQNEGETAPTPNDFDFTEGFTNYENDDLPWS